MDFAETFRELTGNTPFPWQEALYDRFLSGDLPEARNLPTGLGKTAVIPIWLIALAARPEVIPRRLVYVVNRRTVVDQATDEARKIRERISGGLEQALRGLRSAPEDGNPLAISTLRGQFADNREWSADPARPAVIVGTVDMIGSRLLFGGYGVGFRSRPLHAGFLGQDALLVHDEAHLEPAFQALIDAIAAEQRTGGESRPLRVMELSATSRGDEDSGLTERDLAVPEVRKRFHAKKAVRLHAIDDEKKLADRLAELVLEHRDSGRTILVYARGVAVVEKIVDRLRKEGLTVAALTGTMRGKERDELVDGRIFRRFMPGAKPEAETAYLVCTSAGEVGVNISADHLVCDLSTFESMAQRFGRVNRFGDAGDTRIDIVFPTEFSGKDPLGPRLKNTLELIRKLDGDGSPGALSRLDPEDRKAAFSPDPPIPPTSDILFDAWSLTTIRDRLPGRPPVEPYLHGESDPEPPETRVAWRDEVGIIGARLAGQNPPKDLLEDYPLKPHELLRDRSDRVFERLASLARRHASKPVWLLDEDGAVEVLTLEELADKDRKDRLHSRTVLLPPRVGGLKGGLLTGNPDDKAEDVADEWLDEAGQRRCRDVWDDQKAPGQMRLIRRIDTDPGWEESGTADDSMAGSSATGEDDEQEAIPGRFWHWYIRPRLADDDGSKTAVLAVSLDVHTRDVTERAGGIARALRLPDDLRRAVVVAAMAHDLGKKRAVWQRSIGNRSPARWLAKSGMDESGHLLVPVEITPYRHEFGSLLDVRGLPEFRELNEDQRDLVLHLIAAHHGRGRPHFPPEEAFDPENDREADDLAAEVPIRFARLQRKYGRWGLAYLESLLRAADYAASASPSRTPEDGS